MRPGGSSGSICCRRCWATRRWPGSETNAASNRLFHPVHQTPQHALQLVLRCRRGLVRSDAAVIEIFQEPQVARLRDREVLAVDEHGVVPKSAAEWLGISEQR